MQIIIIMLELIYQIRIYFLDPISLRIEWRQWRWEIPLSSVVFEVDVYSVRTFESKVTTLCWMTQRQISVHMPVALQLEI